MIAAVTERAFEVVAARAPAGVEVRRLPDALEVAEFIVPEWEGLDVLDELPALRVVQTLSAGTDWIESRVPTGVTLCSATGARDIPVAEWVLGALLAASYGQLRAAHLRSWEERTPRELHGQTVLIVGHGSIGRAVAARLEPFGVEIVGVAGHARGDVHGPEALPALLPGADAVVVLAPLTDTTRGLVDAAFLARMRDGALFVNAGRGAVVETGALVSELATGRLHAVLDVTDPEPLPDGHPLWAHALAVTPHNAGDSAPGDARAIRLAADQLGRYARGEPLLNVVRTRP